MSDREVETRQIEGPVSLAMGEFAGFFEYFEILVVG
jgi:hypothetical protein